MSILFSDRSEIQQKTEKNTSFIPRVSNSKGNDYDFYVFVLRLGNSTI